MLDVVRDEGLHGVTRRLGHRMHRIRLRLLWLLGAQRVRSRYGIALVPNWGDVTFERCASGSYGTFYAGHLANLDVPFLFLDIGANQGLYAVLAAKNPNCLGVYAFEPVPETADLCQANAALNEVAQTVSVVTAAITDGRRRLTMTTAPDHSGTATLQAGATGERVQVDGIDADDLSRLTVPKDARVVVKLDVEGHEPVVVEELLRSALGSRIAELFYECDEAWIDAAALAKRLESHGFREVQRLGRRGHYDILVQRTP